jgi:hypothetical protein
MLEDRGSADTAVVCMGLLMRLGPCQHTCPARTLFAACYEAIAGRGAANRMYVCWN